MTLFPRSQSLLPSPPGAFCCQTTKMRATLGQPWRPRAPLVRSLPRAHHAAWLPSSARLLRRHRHRPGLGLFPVVARSGRDRDNGPSTDGSSEQPGTGWQTFWGVVDYSAWLGAIGTAAAFLITQEAMLAAAPVALPLLALFASKQRERLAAEASRAEVEQRSRQLLERMAQLARGAAGEAAATEIARAVELQAQQGAASTATLRTLEAKLAAIEGSVLSTGSSTREALKESSMAQGRLAQESVARLEALAAAVRRDVAVEVRQSGAEEMAALSRVEARLMSLEGAIRSLEASQSDGMRRLSGSMASALQSAEQNLEDAVRWEAERALEPLRRLPQLLAESMPVIPEVLGPDRSSFTEEGLRAMIAEQLVLASRDILQQQAALLQELRAQPQVIAPQQWNQLGSRLVLLQDEVKQLLAAQEAAGAALAAAAQQAQQAPPADQLESQLAALRADVAALSSSVEALTQLASAPAGALSWRAAAGAEAEAEDEVDPGLTGRLGAAALAAWQQEQQAAQLGEVVQLLKGLAGRLDGLGEQVAAAVTAQQAQQQAATAATLPAAPAPQAAASGEEEAGADSKEAAYQRMQALLAGNGGAAPAMPAAEPVAQGSRPAPPGAPPVATETVPIREWLGGSGSWDSAAAEEQPQQEQKLEPEPAAAVSWSRGAAGAGAAPPSSSNGAGGSGGGTPAFLESQIQYGAALGVYDDRAEAAASQQAAAPAEASQVAAPAAAWTEEEPVAPPSDQPAALADVAQAPAPAEAWAGEAQAAPTSAQPAVPPAAQGSWEQAQPQWQQWEQQQYEQQYYAGAVQQPEQQQQWQQPPEQQWQWQEQPTAPEQQQQAWAAPAGTGYATQWDTGAQPAQWAAAAAVAGTATIPPATPGAATVTGPPAAAAQPAAPQVPLTQPVGSYYNSLEGLGFEQLFARGRERLQQGRQLASTPGADLGLADSLLWEAEECFEASLQQQPENLKALGNLGNALLAHGRLKLQMLRLLPPPPAPGVATDVAAADADTAATRARLEEEAQSLLLLAGRKYKRVLELDEGQARAMVNWGRCVGLRADVARERGRLQDAAGLFANAADKFDAALDVDPQNGQAMQLAGLALLDQALCLVELDAKQARTLLKDAEAYLASTVAADAQDFLSVQKLDECRQWLDYLRGTGRYAG